MSYQRKRVVKACDPCRSQKRRCPGGQPCVTCTETNTECIYTGGPADIREPARAPRNATASIFQYLDRIEAMIDEQAELINAQRGCIHAAAAVRGVQVDDGTPARKRQRISHPGASSSSTHHPESSRATAQTTLTAAGTGHAAPLPTNTAGAVPARPVPPVYTAGAFPGPPGLPAHTVSTAPTQPGPPALIPPIGLDGQQLSSQESFLPVSTLLLLPIMRTVLQLQHNVLRHAAGESSALATPLLSSSRTMFVDIERYHLLPPQLSFLAGSIESLLATVDDPAFTALPGGGARDKTMVPTVLLDCPPSVLKALAADYFAHVHAGVPLFLEDDFQQWEAALFAQLAPWTGSAGALGSLSLSSGFFASSSSTSTSANVSWPAIETAVCLIVWALGALTGVPATPATTTPSQPMVLVPGMPSTPAERETLAIALFEPALKILPRCRLSAWGPDHLHLCQALLLAGAAFSHLGYPLHSTRMLSIANRNLVRIFEERKRQGHDPRQDNTLVRLCWAGYLLQCYPTSELSIPHGGIDLLIDNLPLPNSLCVSDAHAENVMICFIAETAICRLLTRVDSLLYNQKTVLSYLPPSPSSWATAAASPPVLPLSTNPAIAALLTLGAELDRQVVAWYHTIPVPLRPILGMDAALENSLGLDARLDGTATSRAGQAAVLLSPRLRLLRLHFYAARHVIQRPFVLAVAWSHQLAQRGLMPAVSYQAYQTPQMMAVLDRCVLCVTACRAYVSYALPLLGHRSPALFALSQGTLSCLLVLLVAETCPVILSWLARHRRQQRFPPPEETSLGVLRDHVAAGLRPWAAPGSAISKTLAIIETLPM